MKLSRKFVITSVLLTALLSANVPASDAAKANTYNANVVNYTINSNGDEVHTDYLKLNIDGTTYLSLRDLARILDVKIDWNANTRTIYVDTSTGNQSDGSGFAASRSSVKATKVNFPIFIDGMQKTPQKLEVVVDARTYLSLRDLANMLDVPINWDNSSRQISISTKNSSDNSNSRVEEQRRQEQSVLDEQRRQEEQRQQDEEQKRQEEQVIKAGNYDISDEMLSLVNDLRAENGVAPLEKMTDMQDYADLRAKETVELFDHTRPNGESALTEIMRNGYYTAGENIAAGHADAPGTFEQWKNSPGHRANMLNPDFTCMTIGSYSDGNSIYGSYHAQIFGTKQGSGNSNYQDNAPKHEEDNSQSQIQDERAKRVREFPHMVMRVTDKYEYVLIETREKFNGDIDSLNEDNSIVTVFNDWESVGQFVREKRGVKIGGLK